MGKGWIFLVIMAFLVSCNDDYLPKPKGYPRIVLPPHEYQALKVDSLPYFFEYSKYAKALKDSTWMTEPFWMDVNYPGFKATIQISYKPINHDNDKLREYVEDAFTLTSKHQIKASSIQENIMKTPNGHTVVVAELSGEVPSQFQVFTTDSTKNFLRAALYFNTATQNDSLAPIISYVKKDMVHMFNSLEWRN